MNSISRSLFLFCFFVCSISVSSTALAECGGDRQCIGVGVTPTDAAAQHGNPATVTLAFETQAINTPSVAKTIYVAAVGGAISGTATLGALNITGTDATSFTITTGGTCPTNGGAGPTHGGAQCTITVTFNPTSAGTKTAVLHVPLNPACIVCDRTVTLSGADVNPGNDSGVVGLVNAQTQVASRFARAQIFNYQQRMESLHRSGTSKKVSPAGLQVNPSQPPLAIEGAKFTVPVTDLTFQNSPSSFSTDPSTHAFLDKLLGLASTGSTRLAFSNNATETSSGTASGTGSDPGFWISGNLGFGTRAQTSDSNNLQFSTEGISLGIDKRYSERLVLGMGLGYARDHTLIGNDGSINKAVGTSLSIYSSYQATENTFIDALLGTGLLVHDADRYVVLASDFARSQRKGQQWFGAITSGYEHRKDNLLLVPYSRFDFAIDRLDQTAETGAGTSAITYLEQTQRAMQLSIGLRAEASHATRFGQAKPYVRIEYNHDLSTSTQSGMAYSNQSTGTTYTTTPAMTSGNNAILLGLGSDFLLHSGLKFGIDYQTQRSLGPVNSHALRFWMAKELDGKTSGGGTLPASLFDNPVRVDAGFSRDDNINRTANSSDKLTDNTYSLNINKSTTLSTSLHTRLLLSGFAGVDKQQQYAGLDHASGGLHGEWQYRPSAAFDAPTFGIFTRVTLDKYTSKLRSGNRISTGISARQIFTENLTLFSALSNNLRNAENEVFSTRDKSLRFNLEFRPDRVGTLYLGGEFRLGDTVSTSIATIHSAALADAIVADDAFGTTARNAYRFEAKTTLLTLGYNLALGSRDSIDFFWRRVDTTSLKAPNYLNLPAPYLGQTGPDGAAYYLSNQVGVAYLMRF